MARLGRIQTRFRAIAKYKGFFQINYIASIAIRIGEALLFNDIDPRKCQFRVHYMTVRGPRIITLVYGNQVLAEQDVEYRSSAEENMALLGHALAGTGVAVGANIAVLGFPIIDPRGGGPHKKVLEVRAAVRAHWPGLRESILRKKAKL
jgi:hypothetical protein